MSFIRYKDCVTVNTKPIKSFYKSTNVKCRIVFDFVNGCSTCWSMTSKEEMDAVYDSIETALRVTVISNMSWKGC